MARTINPIAKDKVLVRLAMLFDIYGWKWAESEKPPTAEEIGEWIKRLANDAEQYGTTIASGRILVSPDSRGAEGDVYLYMGRYRL